VNLVSVSETLGDIAVVSSANPGTLEAPLGGSLLRLHSINAVLIGTVATRDSITALCFSCAPEGVSVNVIAAGLASGAIRLETLLIHFDLNTFHITIKRKYSQRYLKRSEVLKERCLLS